MTMMKFLLAKVLLLTAGTTVLQSVEGAPLNDLIVELPGYGKTPTPQFSGYLNGIKGCDVTKNGPICKIHYWLALADDDTNEQPNDGEEEDPASTKSITAKPTVLWLNGGPGSSSLLGYVQEVGPLLMNASGSLMENPYAWTKAGVNLLAIEAPMGVGFSYCSAQEQGQPCTNSDTSTAQVSRAALVDFFQHKFPELAAGPFYIAGESYAGVYIPTLTKELLTDPIAKDVVPLKGIMVGDPCTDNAAQRDSMDPLWYANKYGLMDSEIYDTLMSDDCDYDHREIMLLKQLRMKNTTTTTTTVTTPTTMSSKSHRAVGKKWSNHVTASELNQELRAIDDLTERRMLAEQLYHDRVLGHNDPTGTETSNTNIRRPRTTRRTNQVDQCTLALRKFLLSSSDALSQGWDDLYIDDYSLFAPITNKEDEQMAAYFNTPAVRKALHVEETPIETWPSPDVGFQYYKEYNACNWQATIKYPTTSMVDIYQEIIPQLERTWIYNGDTDPCVSYEGTREAVKQILLDEIDGGSYRPWFYNQTATSLEVLAEKAIKFGPNLVAQSLESAQFGGEVVDYEQGLKFVTFHGSGHMVPQFRPQSALHFLNKFVHGNTVDKNNEQGAVDYLLSPLLPPNATLVQMSDDEFDTYMDAWTESAMFVPYVLPVNN